MVTCNIGCGSDTWGDIRIDFTRKPKGFHLSDGKTSSANIIADAMHLPFVDKCFEETRCYQVLEHLPNWKQGFKEICRVSKKLDITVPCVSHVAKNEWMFIIGGALTYASEVRNSPLGLRNIIYFAHLPERCREHLWQFDIKVLKNELAKMNFKRINIETTNYNILKVLNLRHVWRIRAS